MFLTSPNRVYLVWAYALTQIAFGDFRYTHPIRRNHGLKSESIGRKRKLVKKGELEKNEVSQNGENRP